MGRLVCFYPSPCFIRPLLQVAADFDSDGLKAPPSFPFAPRPVDKTLEQASPNGFRVFLAISLLPAFRFATPLAGFVLFLPWFALASLF